MLGFFDPSKALESTKLNSSRFIDMREEIERCVSMYLFHRRAGREKSKDFSLVSV